MFKFQSSRAVHFQTRDSVIGNSVKGGQSEGPKKIGNGGKRLKTDGKRRISAGLAPAAVHVTTAKFRIISTFSASRSPTPPPLQTVTASQRLVSLIFFGVSGCHRAVPRPSQAVTVSWLIRLHLISARRVV